MAHPGNKHRCPNCEASCTNVQCMVSLSRLLQGTRLLTIHSAANSEARAQNLRDGTGWTVKNLAMNQQSQASFAVPLNSLARLFFRLKALQHTEDALQRSPSLWHLSANVQEGCLTWSLPSANDRRHALPMSCRIVSLVRLPLCLMFFVFFLSRRGSFRSTPGRPNLRILKLSLSCP